MIGAIVAGLAGVVAGLGLAAANPGLVVMAVVVGAIGIFLDRARLADHRVPTMVAPVASQTGWEDVHRELARARRFKRSMAIVRLPGADGSDGTTRATAIAPYLRRIDRVWSEHGDVNLLLPDTDRPAAELLVRRLQARQPGAVGSDPGIATFPVDGLTSGALLSALYGAPLPSVPVPVGIGRPADESADVIDLRPHLVPDDPATDRRESSS